MATDPRTIRENSGTLKDPEKRSSRQSGSSSGEGFPVKEKDDDDVRQGQEPSPEQLTYPLPSRSRQGSLSLQSAAHMLSFDRKDPERSSREGSLRGPSRSERRPQHDSPNVSPRGDPRDPSVASAQLSPRDTSMADLTPPCLARSRLASSGNYVSPADRRRSAIARNLAISDPTMPAPGELASTDPRSKRRSSAQNSSISSQGVGSGTDQPLRPRRSSVASLHQEMEQEHENSVMRMFARIHVLEAELLNTRAELEEVRSGKKSVGGKETAATLQASRKSADKGKPGPIRATTRPLSQSLPQDPTCTPLATMARNRAARRHSSTSNTSTAFNPAQSHAQSRPIAIPDPRPFAAAAGSAMGSGSGSGIGTTASAASQERLRRTNSTAGLNLPPPPPPAALSTSLSGSSLPEAPDAYPGSYPSSYPTPVSPALIPRSRPSTSVGEGSLMGDFALTDAGEADLGTSRPRMSSGAFVGDDDDAAFWQAEASLLTRENQRLRRKVKELETGMAALLGGGPGSGSRPNSLSGSGHDSGFGGGSVGGSGAGSLGANPLEFGRSPLSRFEMSADGDDGHPGRGEAPQGREQRQGHRHHHGGQGRPAGRQRRPEHESRSAEVDNPDEEGQVYVSDVFGRNF